MPAIHDAFLKEYVPEDRRPLDGAALGREVVAAFGVEPPVSLVEFWSNVGGGYFSERELLFFGREPSHTTQRTVVGWNSLSCWRDVLIRPAEGGPVFIAETCLGDQIGFRYGSDRSCKAVLFAVDTCELFVMVPNFDDIFQHLLDDPHNASDPNLLTELRVRLGPLPDDKHYAPIVPTLAGGSTEPHNFHIESATVHVKTAVATWQSLKEG